MSSHIGHLIPTTRNTSLIGRPLVLVLGFGSSLNAQRERNLTNAEISQLVPPPNRVV